MILRNLFIVFSLAIVITGCATSQQPKSSAPPFIKPPSPVMPAEPKAIPSEQTSNKGGYYLDDGPGENPPRNLDQIADAVPRAEKLHPYANQPYSALGQRFVPNVDARDYRVRGVASWYGKRYHGKATASGEIYDMYQMTAAHPILPIPSFARVTNLENNKSVIVRINDRGPFKRDRLIDLSYVAAHKLGYVLQGSADVEVEAVGAAPVAATESGKTYLQLGAFTSRASADVFLKKIRNQRTLLGEALQILFFDGLYRVRSGPYGSVGAARDVAARIEKSTNLVPVVVAK
jgi:rare lipoprotein A